jgi:signal transduction histidine kinase
MPPGPPPSGRHPDDEQRGALPAEVGGLNEIVHRISQIAAQNEQLFRGLVEGERRFRGLARAVWKVQEEEHRRLARELHDGIGQALTALINQLHRQRQRLQGAEQAVNDGLRESIAIAEQALADVRQLSRLLRPPVLDDLGLRAGLSWLARTVREHSGLRTLLEWDAAEEERFDPDVETLVFRIVQEGLNNIVKHSGVSDATIAVRRGGECLEIEIADQGKGFDVRHVLSSTAATGLGLRGVRDRVELFGGRLEVRSAPGGGSRLNISIPLPSREASATPPRPQASGPDEDRVDSTTQAQRR